MYILMKYITLKGGNGKRWEWQERSWLTSQWQYSPRIPDMVGVARICGWPAELRLVGRLGEAAG